MLSSDVRLYKQIFLFRSVVFLGFLLAGCQLTESITPSQTIELPKLLEIKIASLSQLPSKSIVPPETEQQKLSSTDHQHLVILRDTKNRIIQIWLSGRLNMNYQTFGCLAALRSMKKISMQSRRTGTKFVLPSSLSSSSSMLDQRNKVPEPCQGLPRREIHTRNSQ